MTDRADSSYADDWMTVAQHFPSVGAEGLQLDDIHRELPGARLLITKLCPDERLE